MNEMPVKAKRSAYEYTLPTSINKSGTVQVHVERNLLSLYLGFQYIHLINRISHNLDLEMRISLFRGAGVYLLASCPILSRLGTGTTMHWFVQLSGEDGTHPTRTCREPNQGIQIEALIFF